MLKAPLRPPNLKKGQISCADLAKGQGSIFRTRAAMGCDGLAKREVRMHVAPTPVFSTYPP